MAKRKDSKAKEKQTAERSERGSILLEEQVNRLEILLEQIEGCAELIDSHCDLASDGPAMTALAVIKERAGEAEKIVQNNFGRLPPLVLRVRDENVERRKKTLARIDHEIAKRNADNR